METVITKRYFIGESLPHNWATVYNYKPQTTEILEDKGEIFAVISLIAPPTFNAVTAGNLLVDCLHESYFENKKKGILDALDSAILSTQTRLSELLAHEDKIGEEGVDLNITTVVIRKSEIYFANYGSNKILLLPYETSTQVIDISASLRDPFGKGIIKIGSSFLQPDQRFILLTSNAELEIEKVDLISSLSSFNDLRFKNYEFSKTEEIAIFMLGINLNLTDNSVDINSPISSTINSVAINPPVEVLPEDELNNGDNQSELEEMVETTEMTETTETTAPLDDGDEGNLVETEVIESESADSLKETTLAEKLSPRLKIVREKIKTGLQNIPIYYKKLVAAYQKRQEIKKLQSLREKAADDTNSSELPGQVTASSRTDVDNLAGLTPVNTNNITIKVIADKIINNFKIVIIRIKNYVQQDLIERTDKGIRVRKTSLSFRILAFLIVVICIVGVYSVIRQSAISRDRNNKLLAAEDKLTSITHNIDTIESSPVVTSHAFGDIPQREELLTQIATVQAKFTADLNLIPGKDVSTQQSRLSNLKDITLKLLKADFTLFTDVGNTFEGKVSDFLVLGQNVYILDKMKGKIYRQPIRGGNAEVVIDGLNSPAKFAADGDGNLVVYDSGGSGGVLALVNPVTKSITRFNNLTSAKLPEPSAVSVYQTNNNFYLVAPGLTKVLQTYKVGKSYGNPISRASDPSYIDLRGVKILNGRIVILAGSVGLVEIGVGNITPDAFPEIIAGVKESSAFATDDDYIYLLDSPQNKLLIFAKPRQEMPVIDYVGQLDLTKIAEPILTVGSDKKNDLVFLGTSSKIYTFTRSQIQQ